jgi:hypothetical protein
MLNFAAECYTVCMYYIHVSKSFDVTVFCLNINKAQYLSSKNWIYWIKCGPFQMLRGGDYWNLIKSEQFLQFCFIFSWLLIALWWSLLGARSSIVGWDTMLQDGGVRGFCSWFEFFQFMWFFQPHYGPAVVPSSNRNEYQDYSWGLKCGRHLRLTTHRHLRADCLDVSQPSGPTRPVTFPLGDHFLKVVESFSYW